MWVDTHCHIDAVEFDPDRADVIAASLSAGLTHLVIPAVERANFGAVTSVCREFSCCRPAYGIHPMYVDRAIGEDIDALHMLVANEHPVAIGEIGLDYFVEPRDLVRQQIFFAAQLTIARNFELPVLLHIRHAVDAVLKQLRHTRVPGGIAHAFNGSRQQADEFLKLGFKLGFGGTMTYPRATRIRELASTLPLESIVLETDAPDLPPEWRAGKRNSPDQLPRIAQTLADLRGISLEQVAQATRQNAAHALPRLLIH
jgi:TatD DNase family protein